MKEKLKGENKNKKKNKEVTCSANNLKCNLDGSKNIPHKSYIKGTFFILLLFILIPRIKLSFSNNAITTKQHVHVDTNIRGISCRLNR